MSQETKNGKDTVIKDLIYQEDITIVNIYTL